MPTPRSDAPCRSHLARAWLGVAVLLLLTGVPVAQAYIGPGAGFAVGTTLFTLFVAVFSALGALLLWPFRWGLRAVRRRRAHAKARVRRVVVLGLDGLEPTLVEQYMAAGKLPNFARLRDQGTYLRLGTTAPPLTPVAWSSFMTGCNPGKHRIFDFLTRDPRTYRPVLSSVEIRPPRRQIRLGRYRLPLGPPQVRLLRKGRPFWNLLGDHGIFSNIIRMPITFPPEKFRGVLLSAMCVPDLRGSQGTFSYYTTGPAAEHIGGEQVHVQRDGDRIRAQLIGPADTVRPGNGPLRCPFEVRVTGRDAAVLKIDGQTYKLVSGRYTPWVRVPFKAGLGITVRGICEFLLLETHPEFRLYVTPIQLDPQSPALPLSHPAIYATYLAKLIGTYATLGLAEDTWGRNAGVLDDATFLHQCLEADEERMRMLADALDKVRQGFIACVLDGPDRVHHMFWRYLEPQHPARRPADAEADISRTRPHAIEEMYVRMDALVGRTLGQCRDPGTLLLVISDHGCASFRRGFDANRWLEEHGYLQLKPDGRGQKYLAGVDWSRTRAYALGLTGIWLNLRGREAQGIVDPADAAALRAELAGQLTGLRDPAADAVAIERVLDAQQIYRGPYREEAPDLVLGYAKGYRVSWEAAIGQPTEQAFHDNTKAWSGDHSIDPRHVPGVLFSNRRVQAERPHITDLAPTILTLFGVPVPAHMDGCPLEVADGRRVCPEGRIQVVGRGSSGNPFPAAAATITMPATAARPAARGGVVMSCRTARVSVLALVVTGLAALAGCPNTYVPINTAPGLQAVYVVPEANYPTGLAVADDGRVFYTEKETGRIRVVVDGVLQEAPVAQVPVNYAGDRGLLGIALHPAFNLNHRIYVFYTRSDTGAATSVAEAVVDHRVVYFVESNNLGGSEVFVLSLPAVGKGTRVGGQIAFLADDSLLVALGDQENQDFALDANSLPGKILRYKDDGSLPTDNPTAGSAVYASGLRNPQGLAVDPQSRRAFVTDRNPTDRHELDLVVAGRSFGWPEVIGKADTTGEQAWVAQHAEYADPWIETGSDTSALIGPTFNPSTRYGVAMQLRMFYGSRDPGRVYAAALTSDRLGLGALTLFAGGLPAPMTALCFTPTGALYVASDTAILRIDPYP